MIQERTKADEGIKPAPTIQMEDGADLSLVDIYSLLGSLAGESVSRSTHVGLWNTLTSAMVYGTGSTREGVRPLYPKTILHEFQPGRTEEEDYPNHILLLRGKGVVTLSDTANGGPALYFHWREGAQEELASFGFPQALSAASPAQFYLQATVSPTGERFPTMSEYLLDQEVVDMRPVLEISARISPERFYRVIDKGGNYYDLCEVGEETLSYRKGETDEVVVIPRAEVAEKAYRYLEVGAQIAKEPGVHISQRQNDWGVLVDSVFLVAALGIIESLSHDSGVVYHASGTQMYRYLTENSPSGRARREQVNVLYREIHRELSADVALKDKLKFVVFPTSEVVPFTVGLVEGESLARGLSRVVEIGELKDEVSKKSDAVRSRYQRQISEEFAGIRMDKLAQGVLTNYPSFPAQTVERVLSSFPARWRDEVVKLVMSGERRKQQEELEIQLVGQLLPLGDESQVVERIGDVYTRYLHPTEARRLLETSTKGIKPQVLKELQTRNYRDVFGRKLAQVEEVLVDALTEEFPGSLEREEVQSILTGSKDGKDEIGELNPTTRQLAAVLTARDQEYQRRREVIQSAGEEHAWEDCLETEVPDLSPRQVVDEVSRQLFAEAVGSLGKKIAQKMVREDTSFSQQEKELRVKLDEFSEAEVANYVGQHFGQTRAEAIPEVIAGVREKLVMALEGTLSQHLAEEDPEIVSQRNELRNIIAKSEEDLWFVQASLSNRTRELTQFDGQLFIHPLGLQTPLRELPALRQRLLDVCKSSLKEIK